MVLNATFQVIEVNKSVFVDPVYRDRVLSAIVDDVTKTGRMVTLAEMISRDPQKQSEIKIVDVPQEEAAERASPA